MTFNTDTLLYWVRERERIRLQKEAGMPAPWTKDPILRDFRFCNVRREDDKVTRWLNHHWVGPNGSDPDLWFAMTVARHLNLPDALVELGYPVPWKPKRFLDVVRARKAIGLTAYNAAYMIRAASGKDFVDKAQYLAEAVFTPLWRRRNALRPQVGSTLEGFHAFLQREYGMGSFMSAQVLCDISYQAPLSTASDWDTFAASGPGSRRGMNRVLGRPVASPWREADWRAALAELRMVLKPQFKTRGLTWIHARNAQNCLCEISKYEKARLGEGRPKQRYDWSRANVISS